MAAEDDRWVVLTSDLNAVHLEIWRELLTAEGIPAQIPGLRHGQMFAGQLGGAGVGVEVRVRASDAQRARELLESLDLGELVDRDHDPDDSEPPPRLASGEGKGPYRSDPRDAVRSAQPKRALLSTGVGVFMTFGAAHFYTGEIASGIVLALTEVFAFGMIFTGQTVKGAVMLALGILIDIVFASGAVLRANADKRYSLIGQLARTVPLVLAALLIAHGLSRAFPWP